jgi:hypothetical protein
VNELGASLWMTGRWLPRHRLTPPVRTRYRLQIVCFFAFFRYTAGSLDHQFSTPLTLDGRIQNAPIRCTLSICIWWRRGESNPRVASVVAMLQRIICPVLVTGWAGPDSRRHSCGQTIFKVLSRAHASKQDCAVNQSVRTFGAHQNNPRPRNWTNAMLSMSTESSLRTETVQSP